VVDEWGYTGGGSVQINWANASRLSIAGKGIYRHDAEGSDDMPVSLSSVLRAPRCCLESHTA